MSLQKGEIPGTGTESSALTFMQGILEPFKEELQISRVEQFSESAAKVACLTFRLPACYQICLTCMDGEIVYGAVGMKRKDGYYFIRGEQFQKAHTIDLSMFLSMAFLIGGIHQIKKTINLPLVQNVFKEYLNKTGKRTSGEDKQSMVESIRQELPLSIKEFFRTYESNGMECFCLNCQSQLISDAVHIFCKVLEIYRDISYESRHRSEIARSIATAYITKKNIPRSVHSAMEHIVFMDYFKHVEFDEDVNFASVRTIEKEFEVLNHAYFAGKPFKEVTLRFRKLGKHKASGLYYPTLHTLCVDIRCPSSFIHEYFHMIDDQLGDLSLEVAFNRITALYREKFLRQMEQLDDAVKNTLNGKSKYNIQYFFRRAEIFARCDEIYFTRILKVESSLIAPDLAYAYPKSEELDNEIKDYYEALLNKRLPSYGLKKRYKRKIQMAKEIFAADIAEHFTRTVETTFLLREITKRETQENKKPYYDILLQDSSGTFWGTIWEELMEESHEGLKGSVVSVKALITKEAQSAFRLVVRRMEAVDDYQMADYINGLTKEESAHFTEIL